MIRLYQAHVQLHRDSDGLGLDLTTLVQVESPDDERPLADDEAARQAALAAVKPFLSNKVHVNCANVAEVNPSGVIVAVTRTDAEAIADRRVTVRSADLAAVLEQVEVRRQLADPGLVVAVDALTEAAKR